MKKRNYIFSFYLLGLVLMLPSINAFGQSGNEKVTDIDGNEYSTITIGTQTWMVEDLKVTKYNSGAPIQFPGNGGASNLLQGNNKEWESVLTGAYCWYNNDIANKTPYGGLYNWYAVDTGNLAPKGWHVPSREEWQILVDYLGGKKIAGGKLKSVGTSYWPKPNKGADNSSGFTAIPGGERFDSGNYGSLPEWKYWWTSTKSNILQARFFAVSSITGTVFDGARSKNQGFSIRCIKD